MGKAEPGGMRPQAKEALEPPEPGRASPTPPREHGSADTLILNYWLPEL